MTYYRERPINIIGENKTWCDYASLSFCVSQKKETILGENKTWCNYASLSFCVSQKKKQYFCKRKKLSTRGSHQDIFHKQVIYNIP